MVFAVLLTALAASVSCSPVDRRQVDDGSATLAQRAAFFCPPGIDATLPLDQGREAGLRFCSNIDRWSPATLYSSNPLSVGSGNYRVAASRCAALCTGICQTFSVAPATPGNATFGCNLYNATVPFRGNTNGGLFYARQNVAGALPQTVTQTQTQTVCPTPVAPVATVIKTVTGPTNTADVKYPIVYHPVGQAPITVVRSDQVVTKTEITTSTITKTVDGQVTTVVEPVAKETSGPFIVIIAQVGVVQVTQIVNNIVTVVVVKIDGTAPASTVTQSVAPTATPNSFQCPSGIVGQYQDTTNPGSVFNLRFCSNTQRWSPADLFSSTQIPDASYASAARACSQRCNSLVCQTFSVAPTTVGGSTFGCNLYNATNVFNGPTNGGLFYQRQAAQSNDDQQADQCVGSLTSVTGSGVPYSREFCSRTERWSPATLFDGSVQTGQTRNSAAPIVEAVQKCAERCSSFGDRCRTFSTTFTEANPPLGDSALPVNFNCNIYNATLRVPGNTQGGAFYLGPLGYEDNGPFITNGTMTRRFIH